MEITELLWLDAVIDKIESKHHVTPTEVKEVLSNRPRIRKMNRGHFRGEDVYRLWDRPELDVISQYFLSTSRQKKRSF